MVHYKTTSIRFLVLQAIYCQHYPYLYSTESMILLALHVYHQQACLGLAGSTILIKVKDTSVYVYSRMTLLCIKQNHIGCLKSGPYAKYPTCHATARRSFCSWIVLVLVILHFHLCYTKMAMIINSEMRYIMSINFYLTVF